MSQSRVFGWVVLCLAVAGLLGGVSKSFGPPRIAVVDVSEVFEGYSKKKDRQGALETEMNALKAKLSELEKEYEDLTAELKTLNEESSDYVQKNVAKKEMELRVLQLKNKRLKELREMWLQFLTEIRDEIQQEVQAFARAHDLDLVLEKRVTADNEASGGNFVWPIAHYTKPEFDITEEIKRRLNANYKRKT